MNLFTSPALARIRTAYLSGERNEYETIAALLRASVGELVGAEHDRSPLGRMAWAFEMMGKLVREKAEPSKN